MCVAFTLIGCALPDESDPEFEDESEADDLPEATDEPPGIFELPAIGDTLRVCGASALNHRSGPGTQFSILRTLVEDSTVVLAERSGNWARVTYQGLDGWSFARYLCAISPPPPTTSDSQSIGSPNDGRLSNAAEIAAHPHYVIANTGRSATYGTAETLYWIRTAFDSVGDGAPRPQIRDISVRKGGRPSGAWPHASHQSGRDADITYPLAAGCSSSGCPLADVTPSTLDVATTWSLLETWLTARVARRIFIDTSLHAVLKQRAAERGFSAAKIASWFGPIIMHVANHKNHLHVRFVCPADDDQCTN